MQELTYNFKKQALKSIKGKESVFLQQVINAAIEQDVLMYDLLRDSIYSHVVIIKGALIKVVFHVNEKIFTLYDYNLLKIIVNDDIEDCINN